MKPEILMIGEADVFLLNIFRGSLMRFGFSVISANATVSDVAPLHMQTKNWFLCVNERICRNDELLHYLKERIEDEGVRFYILGSREEVEETLKVIPEKLFTEIFYRPANVPIIAKRLMDTVLEAEKQEEKPTVLIVDDDPVTAKAMAKILGEDYVTFVVTSGTASLLFLKEHKPDLVLMDVEMPGMNGFDVFMKIREVAGLDQLPIIFLTGTEMEDAEERGLDLGAADFIQKPVAPGILRLRVRHTVELTKLREHLAKEVEQQTARLLQQREKIELMSMQIVEALSGAIDAKDTYTNGHSVRVAEYSREIARRYGYDEERQQEIFMVGMLHDVGKIGIPNEIINSPTKLTDEQYEIMKTHPVIGAEILGRITTIPNIAIGAHWHHERYDGRGYPDGLKGEETPEIARIIGVADAYDAMTSRRSYRDPMPQEKVKGEIERNIGTQFDPVFGKIMLEMIEEDKDYMMHE